MSIQEVNQPKIIHLDATAFSKSACRRRLTFTVDKGYSSRLKNNDIEFGIAVHLFKAEIRKQKSDSYLIGMKRAIDYYRNKKMLIKKGKEWLNESVLVRICDEYFGKYGELRDNFEPIFVDGEPLVELKFSVPYYVSPELIIFLSGIVDEIGKLKGGCYCIADLKNTSMWNTNSYFDGYQLSTQMIFYRYMLKLHAKLYPNSIFAEIDNLDCGCFIDGIFLKKDQPPEFKRSGVFLYKEDILLEYESLIQQTVDRIMPYLLTNTTPPRDGMVNSCCESTKYGRCDFFDVCAAPDSIAGEYVLNNNFITKHYNPLELGS